MKYAVVCFLMAGINIPIIIIDPSYYMAWVGVGICLLCGLIITVGEVIINGSQD